MDTLGAFSWFLVLVLGSGLISGLMGIAKQLQRIAAAVEESNKLRSRQMQP